MKNLQHSSKELTVQLFKNSIILLLIFGASCMIRKDRKDRRTSKQSSPYVSLNTNETNFFLVEKPEVDPEDIDLEIFRAFISRVKIAGSYQGKVSYTRSQPQDSINYINWSACSKTVNDYCKVDKTLQNSFLLGGDLPSDSYEVTLQACIEIPETDPPEHYCGKKEVLSWQQAPSISTASSRKSEAITRVKKELKHIGEKLFILLKEIKEDFKSCPDSDSDTQNDIVEAIQIQIENLVDLGPDFISSITEGIRLEKDDEQLASVLEVPTEESEDRIQNLDYDPDYQPDEGFFLDSQTTQLERIKEIYGVQGSSLVLPNKLVLDKIKGSNGFFEDTETVYTKLPSYTKLSPQDRCHIRTLYLLQNKNLTKAQKAQFASYESLNCLMQIKSSSFQLAETCVAFVKAENILKAIRNEVAYLKRELNEVQEKKLRDF